MRITSILCSVDFSHESPKLVSVAVRIAARERAKLTVLHVLDPLVTQAARIEFEKGLLENAADEDLRALIGEATKESGLAPASVDRRIRVGSADVEILLEASERDVDLIVISTHGLSGVRRLFFGSTTARVLAQTTRPVLALPPGDDARGHDAAAAAGEAAAMTGAAAWTRLLVAVDFTEVCMKAARQAAALAHQWNLPLTLVHAIPAGPRLERWKAFVDADHARRIALATYRLDMLAQELARASDDEPRLAVTVVAEGGSPEDVIARVAAEQPGTLVVMGLRERGMFTPGPGSTAYRVLGMTSSPVLILPMAASSGRAQVGTRAAGKARSS